MHGCQRIRRSAGRSRSFSFLLLGTGAGEAAVGSCWPWSAATPPPLRASPGEGYRESDVVTLNAICEPFRRRAVHRRRSRRIRYLRVSRGRLGVTHTVLPGVNDCHDSPADDCRRRQQSTQSTVLRLRSCSKVIASGRPHPPQLIRISFSSATPRKKQNRDRLRNRPFAMCEPAGVADFAPQPHSRHRNICHQTANLAVTRFYESA